MSIAMEVRTKFDIRPLSPVLGAVVVGLDLAQPRDAATRRVVYDAFCRYQVLCFRDQLLSKDQQIAFTEQFGTLERHIARNRGTDNPLVHTVSNLGPDGKPNGGDTCFADMYAAYEALSDDEKTELDGVRAIHSWEQSQLKHGRTATPEE